MRWIEICVESNIDITEEVSEFFFIEGANGTQIQNPDEIKSLIDEAGAIELAEYKDFSSILDKYRIIAYFPTETDIENLKVSLSVFFEKSKGALNQNKVLYSFFWNEVDDENWKHIWKEHYKPFNITKTFRVVPSWEKDITVDANTIIVDPGMAFGTGTHESTSLCANMIEERLKKGDTFLDIGTGTGILSIIALRLGAKKALAIDIDPASVKTAKMNFGINSIINAEVFLGELKDIPNLLFPNEFKAPFKFDVIAANIVSDVIIDLAFEIKKYLSKGGSLICSGIIKERENDVKIALIKAGFSNLVSITKNEWTAITADA